MDTETLETPGAAFGAENHAPVDIKSTLLTADI